jgi:hypothetical protein
MLLSNYILNTGVKPYLEYAWVTAPNTVGQSITNNILNTLTLNTEVADTGNNGSISGNQITLAAGTYLFDISTFFGPTQNYPWMVGMYLLDTGTGNYLAKTTQGSGSSDAGLNRFTGQFTISVSSVLEIQCMPKNNAVVGSNWANEGNFTNSTANLSQRTTIQLWKLA